MNDSKFKKVLSSLDVFVIAFGAMIGWSWVVNTGIWIETAGGVGAALAFVIGSVMILFVGLVYAELTTALPRCGGEHIFSYRALGKNGSYVCSWALLLAYIGVTAFEACAFPTVISYIVPGFLKGYLYTIAGFDVYTTWLLTGVAAALVVTYINFRGTKTAAGLQTVFVAMIAGSGILIIVTSILKGAPANLTSNAFFKGGSLKSIGGILTIAVMTPFLFMGFDVIPQASEEINIPHKKIGKIMIFSIVMALLFYSLIILAVAYAIPRDIMEASIASTNGLVSADAVAHLLNSTAISKVIIIGGLAGIVTSWNSFLLGGSRLFYAMAESRMISSKFMLLHPKYNTPTHAIYLIGAISMIAPFFGRRMLVWITDAGSFAAVIAYLIVCISFVLLQRKEPELHRPYRIENPRFVGTMAIFFSCLFLLLYIVPFSFSQSALCWQEWIIVGIWAFAGIVLYLHGKHVYGNQFGIRKEL